MDDKLLEKVNDLLEDGIRSIVNEGAIKAQHVCLIKDALVAIAMIKECKGGMSGRGYSTSFAEEGGSFRRGRNQNNGQYMSRENAYEGSYRRGSYEDGMSGHSTKDRMIALLEEAGKNGGRIDQREAQELLNRMM